MEEIRFQFIFQWTEDGDIEGGDMEFLTLGF